MRDELLDTHSTVLSYVFWVLGFTGAHRFYLGRPWTGLLWALTGGLLVVGWLVDLFLIPGMRADARLRFRHGPTDYSATWLLFAFLGVFGVHRFFLGKWVSGLVYLLTAGVAGLGLIYDLFTLNSQISDANARELSVRL